MMSAISPLEATALGALRTVLTGMFEAATAVVGSATGTTLTVSSVKWGAIAPAMALSGPPQIAPGTFVEQFLTGRGGIGTYQLNQATLGGSVAAGATFSGGFDVVRGQVNRVASPISPDYAVLWPTGQTRLETNSDGSADCRFVASITGEVMTVTRIDIGALSVGATVWGENVASATRIVAQTSGTPGGTGTYVVAPSPQTVSSEIMACGAKTAEQPWQMTVQIDVHGPNASDNATRISTLLRDEYATSAFATITPDVSPLHADDPKQIPFINDQNQYENRWVVTAQLQVNATVSVPQQYMDAAVVGLIDVDAVYPPHSPPFDVVSGVTITGAWGFARPLLTSWGTGNTGRVRSAGVGNPESDFATPAQADAFLAGNNGTIVSLYDQTGAGHTLTQPTATSQPAYNGALGTKTRAGSVFDAAADKLAGAAMSSFITASSGYFIAVCSIVALTGNQQTIFGQSGGYVSLSIDGSTGHVRATLYDGVSNKITVADIVATGQFFIAEMWWDGTAVYCRVNGGTAVSTAAGSVSATGLSRALTLSAYSANVGLDGAFMEGAAMSAMPEQTAQIIANMKSFYGI